MALFEKTRNDAGERLVLADSVEKLVVEAVIVVAILLMRAS